MPEKYISVKEAIRIVENAPIIAGDENESLISAPDLQDALYSAPPADVVEVVHCGECIHRTKGYPSCKGRPRNWFCANGERRV